MSRKPKVPILQELSGADEFGAIYATAQELRDMKRPSKWTMNQLFKMTKGVAYNIKTSVFETASDVARSCMHSSPLGNLMENMGYENYIIPMEQELTNIFASMFYGKPQRQRNLQFACVLSREDDTIELGARYRNTSLRKKFKMTSRK
jgi:hypothetical protein